MDTERDFHLGEITKYFEDEGYRHFFTFRKDYEDDYTLEITFPDFVMFWLGHLKVLEPLVKVTYIRPLKDKGIVLECEKL